MWSFPPSDKDDGGETTSDFLQVASLRKQSPDLPGGPGDLAIFFQGSEGPKTPKRC